MKPVKFGILGVSRHYGLRISRSLVLSNMVDLQAIGSRSLSKAEKAAAEWGFARAYGSYDEVISDPDVEALYIPLPNHLHIEWIRKGLDAGKAVLCEKPLALNTAEASEVVEQAEKKGLLLMEAFMYRFHPQWPLSRTLVQKGEIGDPRTIHTLFGFNNTDPKNIRNIPETGGGALYDIGCYAASSARFLLGREPQRVMTLMERHPVFKTDVLCSGIMDFGSAQSVFTVSTIMKSCQKVRVQGSGGSLTVELPFNAYPDVPMEVTVQSDVGERCIETESADQYVLMFEAFAKALREGRAAPIPPSDAVANMKVLDALFKSAESGGWVKL